jgi:hypothetical protein
MAPSLAPLKSRTMGTATARLVVPSPCQRFALDITLPKSYLFAEPLWQEDRDAAVAAEREEKRQLELKRQQEEQQEQEQELLQLQVLSSAKQIADIWLSYNCQAAIDALQAKLDKKTRDADNGARAFSLQVSTQLCYLILCTAVRAALRQQEHRLLEEGLRIQQLVEEFKFKQKTIGSTFEIIVALLLLIFRQGSSRTKTPPCGS